MPNTSHDDLAYNTEAPCGVFSCIPSYIWGQKSSWGPDLGETDAFWGFESAYVSKCRNITRCRRNMLDNAFESWWSILSDPKKIFFIRTHPEELRVLKCITSTHISTNFSQQCGQQTKPIISKGHSTGANAFFHFRVDPEANFCHMTMLYISFLISRTMRNFWSEQIFYLTSRKIFWDSRSGPMRQIFSVILIPFMFFIALYSRIQQKSLSAAV